MELDSSSWKRFGGHIILFMVVGLVVWGSRFNREPGQAGGDSMNESAMPLSFEQETQLPPPVITGNGRPAPSVDAVPIVSDNSLAPLPNPRTFQAKAPSHSFASYKVERGDTPAKIADRFGISAATLLGGNPWLSQESNQLQAGTELLILPVDGVLYSVKPGDTLEAIAAQYEVPVEDIIGFASNNLEFPFRLQPETELMIPGGQAGVFYWTAPKTVVSSGGSSGAAAQFAVKGSGTFIWPEGNRCITQYAWYGHPAIDVAVPAGTSIAAADRGTVTYASWAAGTYYDYGNLIVINHGNGFETLYAHLSQINVFPGQVVEKGAAIGATGNTGRSSGPHLHFEIRLNDIRLDPLLYLAGPTQDCTYSAN